jgi:hypothetical protein
LTASVLFVGKFEKLICLLVNIFTVIDVYSDGLGGKRGI